MTISTQTVSDGQVRIKCEECGYDMWFTAQQVRLVDGDTSKLSFTCACMTPRLEDNGRNTSRILVAREAGAVERCHSFPHHNKYTVGEHCYNVVSLLFILNPAPRIELVKACLWHDTAERFLGDLPAPTKWHHPELRNEYAIAEDTAMNQLGVMFDLDKDEQVWLKSLDILELWLWAHHEKHMGNQYADDMIARIEKQVAASTIRPEVHYFMHNYVHHRLPDDFHTKEPKEDIVWNGYEGKKYPNPVEPKPTQRHKVDG